MKRFRRIKLNKIRYTSLGSKFFIIFIAFIFIASPIYLRDQTIIEDNIGFEVIATNIDPRTFQNNIINPIRSIEEETLIKKEVTTIDKRMEIVVPYLIKKNKLFASNTDLVRIILEEAEKAGADYRIVVAIMGNESGYCRVNYKKYNCFGYLNKVQYSSFREAFINVVPKVSRIVASCGWNTDKLGRVYGAVYWDSWGDKIYKMAMAIPFI